MLNRPFRSVSIALILLCPLLVFAAKKTNKPSGLWKFTDIRQKHHDPFANEKTQAIVLVFITTDCPIANYYQPMLTALTEEYGERGVRFFLLHSDRDTKVEAALKHAKEFKTRAPVIMDSTQQIARRVGARVTPEAFLITKKGKTVYQGRINDLYADFGKRRRAASKNDLRDAIEALLAGKKIETPKTRAIGCYIPYPKKQPVK